MRSPERSPESSPRKAIGASGAQWSELTKRLLSSLVLVPIALFCLWWGGWAFDALILLVMVGLVWEAETLLGQNMRGWRGVLLALWPVSIGVMAIKNLWLQVMSLLAAALLLGTRAWGPIAVSSVAGVSLLWLRSQPDGMLEVLFVLAAVVASDSCAYLTGRLVGGPKLAPAISPGKTISGSLGGLVGALVAGALVARWGTGHWSFGACLWGVLLAVAAQSGDLAESAFKRKIGVKDSGTLIPGHGGLLDRFDGLLAAAPLAACAAALLKRVPFWS